MILPASSVHVFVRRIKQKLPAELHGGTQEELSLSEQMVSTWWKPFIHTSVGGGRRSPSVFVVAG